MKASIIIPSYNARERLFLNLTALNGQSYEGDDVEVIVVDNGSTDNTLGMLNEFKLKYPMRVVRIEENSGIAYGRNRGILAAQGDILIFHDSDMIASRDFIKLHLAMHEVPGIVACGLFWRRIFTFYYKKFGYDQMMNYDKVKKSWDIYRQAPMKDGYPLISEQQVKYIDLEPYSFDLEFGFITDLRSIIRTHGRDLEGYYLPWRFCITNNLSVEREKVVQVGMFDTNIIKYGYEDYDLGVRLYKSGCHFIIADHIVSLHQEHPPNYNTDDLVININFMCEKYNNIYFIDVPLVCLSDSLHMDKTKLNGVAYDIYRILVMNEYNDLLELFLLLLQIIRKRIFTSQDDISKAVFPGIMERLGAYAREAAALKNRIGIIYFTQQLSDLLKLAFDIDFERQMRLNQ